jgi:peptidase S41-like protein
MISAPILALALGLAPRDSTLSCATTLALLERKMQLDYAGYTIELRGDRLTRFAAMKRALQERADRTQGDECYFVLRDFVEWFDDPHLFVYQSTRLDTAETTRRAAAVERRNVTEASARDYYRRRGPRLDPIEGIWYDRGMRVAIVPDSALGPGRFVAVTLTSDTSTWSPGAVRARFTRRDNAGYDADVSEPNHALAHRRVAIYRRVLMRFSPGIWGKEFPVPASDSGTLDPVDPHRPVVYRKNGTLVFAIPSHNGFKPALDSLVAQHRAELSSADRLIIDLRGNEGGGSFMTNALEPFVSLKEELPNPFPTNRPLMLSSDDQIAYARRAFGADTTAFVRGLVDRLRASPGELVPLNDPADTLPKPDARDWVVSSGPRRVGVLVDRGTVSASEVFVLYALRSPRATVFGEPTAGALDYQSANIVSISPHERRWLLGYGTITRGPGLPAGGMRGKGIPPQVPLDLRRIEDPVGYVDRALVAPRSHAPSAAPRTALSSRNP